ncbi:MAG: carbohydrate ABC transporter permease [Lachnospirales bacterium]
MEKNKSVENKKIKYISYTIMYLFLLVLTLYTLYPILYIIFGSFKNNKELVSGGTNFLPDVFVFSNYIDAWTMGNFGRYTINSIFLSTFTTIGVLFVSTMAGYVFARKDFKFKKLLFNSLIAFMFVNVGSVSLRPLFELAVNLNLNQTLLGVVIILIGKHQATNIFLVRGYMSSIPKELDDAAAIDGCGLFRTYLQIILPVLKPIVATIALLTFRAGWNEYILPNVFTLSNPDMRPLTVGVVSLKYAGDGAAAWNIMFAGSAMSIIPIVILYLCTSKFFMSGLTSGSVKG